MTNTKTMLLSGFFPLKKEKHHISGLKLSDLDINLGVAYGDSKYICPVNWILNSNNY